MPVAIATKPVHIIGDRGEVDQESVNLSKGGHEELTWFAHDNETATIVFSSQQRSPFAASVFHVPAGGSISSGAIRDDAAYRSYKYSVVGPKGTTDPEVIIER